MPVKGLMVSTFALYLLVPLTCGFVAESLPGSARCDVTDIDGTCAAGLRSGHHSMLQKSFTNSPGTANSEEDIDEGDSVAVQRTDRRNTQAKRKPGQAKSAGKRLLVPHSPGHVGLLSKETRESNDVADTIGADNAERRDAQLKQVEAQEQEHVQQKKAALQENPVPKQHDQQPEAFEVEKERLQDEMTDAVDANDFDVARSLSKQIKELTQSHTSSTKLVKGDPPENNDEVAAVAAGSDETRDTESAAPEAAAPQEQHHWEPEVTRAEILATQQEGTAPDGNEPLPNDQVKAELQQEDTLPEGESVPTDHERTHFVQELSQDDVQVAPERERLELAPRATPAAPRKPNKEDQSRGRQGATTRPGEREEEKEVAPDHQGTSALEQQQQPEDVLEQQHEGEAPMEQEQQAESAFELDHYGAAQEQEQEEALLEQEQQGETSPELEQQGETAPEQAQQGAASSEQEQRGEATVGQEQREEAALDQESQGESTPDHDQQDSEAIAVPESPLPEESPEPKEIPVKPQHSTRGRGAPIHQEVAIKEEETQVLKQGQLEPEPEVAHSAHAVQPSQSEHKQVAEQQQRPKTSAIERIQKDGGVVFTGVRAEKKQMKKATR